MISDPLTNLIAALEAGEVTWETVRSSLERHAPVAVPLDLDLDRARRCGFPEVIYGPGKSIEVLQKAVTGLIAAGQDVLATRLESTQLEFLAERFPGGFAHRSARTWRWMHDVSQGSERTAAHEAEPNATSATTSESCAATNKMAGRPLPVAVVTAGTGDAAVADEAAETLAWMRVPVRRVDDVGVAGPQRLLARLERFRGCGAVVVVAGMEGALPSVVAGHVACPVIGVPTSVGYGANFAGLSALLSMLNSCAANVAVVNIDAGFKAGYLAGMIVRG